ncbi:MULTISPECIES: hypothetical protein [Bradyrhizobium]|uniref:hypothetical protein n=1 Tax=Bradyrhizobium pachyrhizi TaxID=280333 RepID=UPI002AA536B1
MLILGAQREEDVDVLQRLRVPVVRPGQKIAVDIEPTADAVAHLGVLAPLADDDESKKAATADLAIDWGVLGKP